jgi:hypothetical protein
VRRANQEESNNKEREREKRECVEGSSTDEIQNRIWTNNANMML